VRSEVPADRAVIDRIVDGAIAVLLVGPDEVELHVPARDLPEGAGEGSWVVLDREVTRPRLVTIDHELTADRTEDLESRLQRIRRDRSGGRFG